jgi:hypothetical protein
LDEEGLTGGVDILARVQDPDGRVVELTFERWGHIVVEHPELTPYRAEVIAAIQDPYTRLPGQRENECWYQLKKEGPSRWLQVVVAFEGERGWVVTAFARRRMP